MPTVKGNVCTGSSGLKCVHKRNINGRITKCVYPRSDCPYQKAAGEFLNDLAKDFGGVE